MRLGMAMLVAASFLASACNDQAEESLAAKEKADAEAIAQVKEQQIAPPIELELQPIGYDDIVSNSQMEGPGCSFYAIGGEDPLAIMGDGMGFVKIDEKVQRLAADAGSAQGPAGTRATYDGREYALRIAINEAEREDGEGEGFFTAPASIRVVDGYDRDLASAEGRVGCGG